MNDKLKEYSKFQNITFDDFKLFAQNDSLSMYEKIGFPEEFRKNFEKIILNDIINKLSVLQQKNQMILDIGCGCSGLASMLISHCENMEHNLLLVDSKEMLSLLPDKDFIEKIEGKFPDNLNMLENYKNKINGILCYSVLHHVILDDSIFKFIDNALELLTNGGMFLLGDLPNISKRHRFFSSEKGIMAHKQFTGRKELPEVDNYKIEHNRLDDGVIFGILQRYRNFGFETYLLPQNPELPMSGRREDILIVKW